MKYEIPREAFKQRLEERLNFVLVDLAPDLAPTDSVSSSTSSLENVVQLNYGEHFKEQFSAKFPIKTQNILLYSLKKDDYSPAKAADDLAELGYHFVYYYIGSPEDLILDKGIN